MGNDLFLGDILEKQLNKTQYIHTMVHYIALKTNLLDNTVYQDG